MSQAFPPEAGGPATAPQTTRTVLSRGLTVVALVVLLAFVVYEGAILVGEYLVLQHELAHTRATAVVGYPGIHPDLNLAERPRNWYHQEGEDLLLWAGWRKGVGHVWFRVGLNEIDQSHLSVPNGRDVQRPIDRPLVETGGGTFWTRVPDEAAVAAVRIGGVETAYPLLILDKVAIVNDVIQDQPFLVAYDPRAEPASQVGIYETVLDGHRITMGISGIFHDGKPLLYDRGTESLWLRQSEALHAIAGKHRGAVLRAISHPTIQTWSRWRSGHPQCRLLVGADRSVARPEL